MVARPDSPGTVTLMGSGEMTRAMSRVHRWVTSRIEEPVTAVFLDTPAGFELNADEISGRACAYVTEYMGIPCSVASFRSAKGATDREMENALRKLARANYIFAGPGSPTYAVRNWRQTPVFDLVARRVGQGAHLVLASAAAIAVGRYALPVYEIYKVGEEPHWVEGLNLMGPYGLDLAIVSHWNNAEGGTFDTRYCFMGQPRFEVLEQLLPDSTLVLGVDEYTACILDLASDECRVMGAGQVTVRRRRHEMSFKAGTSFSLDRLRDQVVVEGGVTPTGASDEGERARAVARESLLQEVARTVEQVSAGGARHSGLAGVADDIYRLAQVLDQAQEAGAEESLILQAQASLRQFLIAWSNELAPSPSATEASIAPFVDLLIALRSRARADQNWSLADEIRDGLSGLGIVLEDKRSGTEWRMR